MDENPLLDITDLKNKEQCEYIATGCIRWMRQVIKKYIPNSPVNTCRHYRSLTVWGNHNHISKITDIAIRKYYGNKLSTTPMSIYEEIEKESSLDWSDVDVPNYLNHEKLEKEKLLKEIASPKIINVSISTNLICANKSSESKV